MRVLVLGAFEVRGDDDRPIEVPGTRLRALLARLALQPGHVVQTGVLITAIWMDAPPAGAANALQALVSRLRRLVGSGAVEGHPTGYRLLINPSDVDAIRFEQLVAAARDTTDLAMLREADALWRGPALADLVGLPFAADAASRLDELRLAAAEDRLSIELAVGNDVLAELRPLAAAHPMAERLQGLLIRALYAADRQAEALAAYERTRRELAEELGVDPSAELTDLHLAILRQDPDLPTRRRRTNLRAQVTSLVGRAADIDRLTALLATARLVTVVGPGGVGKTRLAVEVAARTADQPGGVWLVELGVVTDPNDVPAAVLAAIGAREAGLFELHAGDAATRLQEFFTGQRALLIMDNCEHLVAPVADLVDRLLGTCPDLRVLTTSREPLAITGEHLHPIRPLPCPADAVDDPASYPAVQLFVERAAAVSPGFALDPTTAAAVVEICRRLDGIPLAIELAAARMRALGVQQVAAKLDDRFAVLTSGSRTAVPRHRTLRAVIAWSWELLSEQERELAMWLAVFPAGATIDILGCDVEVLAGLVDKSLVERVGGRFRMLETIRSYAFERLAETARGPALRGEHARRFLRFTEAADADLRTADQLAARVRLEAERDNILAALRFAVEAGDIDLGVRLLAAMFWFWGVRGIQTERMQWTRAVLDIRKDAPESHRPVMAVLRGLLEYEDGAVDAGASTVATGIALSRRPGTMDGAPGRTLLLVAPAFLPRQAAAPAMTRISAELSGWERAMTLLLWATGAGFDAFDRLEEARQEFERLGERLGLSWTLRNLADQHALRGDLPAAVAALTRAVGLIEELGSAGDGAEAYAELARMVSRTGELDRAHVALKEAGTRAEEGGEPRAIAYVRLVRAEILIRLGDRAEAARELDAAERGFDTSVLGPRVRVLSASFRAQIALLDGDGTRARQLLDAAVAPGVEGVELPDLAVLAHMYAAVAVLDGAADRAAYLIGLAAGLLGTEDRSGHDNLLRPAERACELLGAEAFAEALDRGAALAPAAAIEVLRSRPLGP